MAVLHRKRRWSGLDPIGEEFGVGRMTTSDDFVEVECEFKTATKAAVLIAQDGREIWVPRTCLSWSSDKTINDLERGNEWRMKVREWFASKNDLEYIS